MLYREIIAGSEIRTKYTNELCEQNVYIFNVTPGLKGINTLSCRKFPKLSTTLRFCDVT